MNRNILIQKWSIYRITNPTGRVYIGKSKNIKQREMWYRGNYGKSQKAIFMSIQKYGWDAHIFEVIDTFLSDNYYANIKEKFWVKVHRSNKCAYPEFRGLNLTNGGDGVCGIKKTKEQKEKISAYQKLNPNSGQFKKGNVPWSKGVVGLVPWNKGKKGVQTSWRKGMKMEMTEEERYLRYVKPRLGKPSPRKGVKMKPEWVEKMAASKRGKSNYKVMKPVNQFSKDGAFIKSYGSLKEASVETGVRMSGISQCLTGFLKTSKGYSFKYAI